MGKVRELTITPPTAGVVNAVSYQQQPPYSSAGALNVWGVDVKTGRKRASVRPRYSIYSTSITASTSGLVRGLAAVNVVTNQTLVRGLFAIGDTDLWRLTSAGTFTSVGGTYSTTRYISMQPYLEKLFIADGTDISYFECTGNSLVSSITGPGTPPTSVTLIAEWAGRLVVSGQSATPHAVYMSRIGDPLDWDYAETDVAAAVNMTTFDEGLIGEKVTALISHNRECLIIGATDSMHVLRGNPLDGGRLEIISHVVGPLSASSWCKTADDQTVIMTRNGLYVMPPGCGVAPQPLSRDRIPDSLVGIDTSTTECFLAFDTRFNGLHIYLTQSGSCEAWWMDWETGAFWPMELTSSEKPYSILRFDPLDGADKSGVLLGCADTNIRQFDRTDAGAITNAYLYIGPLKLSSSPMLIGLIQKMVCTFSTNTTDTTGTIAIYCAESGEAAYAAAVADTAYRKFSITFTNQSNNLTSFPRVGGHAAVIKVTLGSTTAHWALEQIALRIEEKGAYR